MLFYPTIFLLLAILSGVAGFGAAVGTAALVLKACFLFFLALFVASLLRGAR